MDSHELVDFVDSGSDLLDLNLVHQVNIETKQLPFSLPVRALDGYILHQASSTLKTKPLLVTIVDDHHEWLSILVIPSPRCPLCWVTHGFLNTTPTWTGPAGVSLTSFYPAPHLHMAVFTASLAPRGRL